MRKRLFRADGTALCEYVLLLSLLAMVVIPSVTALQGGTSGSFDQASLALCTGGGTTTSMGNGGDSDDRGPRPPEMICRCFRFLQSLPAPNPNARAVSPGKGGASGSQLRNQDPEPGSETWCRRAIEDWENN